MSKAAAVFNEAPTMSNTSSLLNISNPGHPANRLMTLIKFGVLVVSVAAAVPTARNLYFSFKNDVPFDQVDHRLAQAALLEKNFDCKISYRALTTSSDAKVEVGSCQKTGDISIRVISRGGQTNYEWIAFDQLPKPVTKSASLMDLVVSRALAAERTGDNVDGPFEVADDAAVLCQKKVGDTVIRIVQSGGQCVRETVSIYRGAVESSSSVPCSSACPIR